MFRSSDVRHILRGLLSAPAFSIAALLILSFALGVHAAVLRVTEGLSSTPIQANAPEELRYVYTLDPPATRPFAGTRYREFLQLAAEAKTFSGVAATAPHQAKIQINSYIDRVRAEAVSANYFSVLGVRPFLGRTFDTADGGTAAEPVVIISHQLWQSHFNGDPRVLGGLLRVNRSSRGSSYAPWKHYTIVGVMPREFAGVADPWDETKFWIPFLQRAEELADQYRSRGRTAPAPDEFWVLPIVRVPAGTVDERAAEELEIFAAAFRASRSHNLDWTLRLAATRQVSLPFDPDGRLVPERLSIALFVLSSALLLIAAANLSGLILGRAISQRREHATRLALGCGVWRLCGLYFGQVLLLAALGGVGGVAISRWLLGLLLVNIPAGALHDWSDIMSLDFGVSDRVLMLTLCSAVGMAFVCTIPVVRILLASPTAALVQGGVGSVSGSFRPSLWRLIVVPQVCLSFVLLVPATVLVRGTIRSELSPPGYTTSGVVLADFELPEEPLPPAGWTVEFGRRVGERRRGLLAQFEAKVQSFGQIDRASVSLTSQPYGLPLAATSTSVVTQAEYRYRGAYAHHRWASHTSVGSAYFSALQVPILQGREFTAADTYTSPKVGIVSAQLARALWPDKPALGELFGIHEPSSQSIPQWIEVVGVAGDTEPPLSDGWSPSFYTPVSQQLVPAAFTIVVRGRGSPADLLRIVSEAASQTDSSILVSNGRTFEHAIERMKYPRRASAILLGITGLVGLAVAVFGLYGITSFSVSQRVREIGVRLAVGARPRDIVAFVLREGIVVATLGITLGAILHYVVSELTARFEVPVSHDNWATFLIVPSTLFAAILLACYVPASRAAKIDPKTSLGSL